MDANVIAIAASAGQSLALTDRGEVYEWGDNVTRPTRVLQVEERAGSSVTVPLTDVVAIAAGDHHSLALKTDGTLWGCNRSGPHISKPGVQSPKGVPAM